MERKISKFANIVAEGYVKSINFDDDGSMTINNMKLVPMEEK
jgi:hypothetical protein